MVEKLDTAELKGAARRLTAGERILLSGTVYTARDAAHKRMTAAIASGEPLPFEVDGAVIYYAGPTPAVAGTVVGSCGPTTSGRMDIYTPTLLNMGLAATIGKGDRDKTVRAAMMKNGAVYLCAVGGAGALACRCITDCEVIAYEELGCESVKRLRFKDFPLIVAIDSTGKTLF